jgi:hypothetical protein
MNQKQETLIRPNSQFLLTNSQRSLSPPDSLSASSKPIANVLPVQTSPRLRALAVKSLFSLEEAQFAENVFHEFQAHGLNFNFLG